MLEVVIFTVEAICMILELIASRVLSPYFGNSNIVWTSIIGVILLSNSIGNYYGGIIADKEKPKERLKRILMISAVYIFFIPLVQKQVIESICILTSDIRIGAIIATSILFFVPSIFLGLITPIILKSKLKDLENAGKVSGKIQALATLGGITGTFLGGFILIPNIGSVYILFFITIILAILVSIIDFKIKDKTNILVAIIIMYSIISMLLSISKNNNIGKQVLNNDTQEEVSYDTQYGRILIYNGIIDGKNARILNIDSGFESATFTDEDKVNDLVFEYTRLYDLMFKASIDIKDTLLIGGGGYSYPKHYISKFIDKNMDVVEIDGEVTNIAKKYFYLDKLFEDYNLSENKRLNLITEDGRTYLNRNNKKYDAILNDSFSGSSPAKTLTTIEAISKIKSSLNENGVYLSNVISSLDGKDSRFIKAEVNTLKKVFKNVYIVPCNKEFDNNIVQNNMVISTDYEINFEDNYNLKMEQDEIVLTDDYCPVDMLIPQI